MIKTGPRAAYVECSKLTDDQALVLQPMTGAKTTSGQGQASVTDLGCDEQLGIGLLN